MALQSIRNHRGFFSDYWLGTALGARAGAGARLTAAQARKALDRLSRLMETVNGAAAPNLTQFRERFARPVLHDFLGFALLENAEEPRVRALSVANGADASADIALLALLCPEPAELESKQSRRQLEDALLAADLDYGFLLSSDVLRLVRTPGATGARGASFDLALASAVELDDLDSLAAAFRVLAAQNFVRGTDGTRPIDGLEIESRRHSSKVSNDLKAAVFEAAERTVAGFLADTRERPGAASSPPTLGQLRDVGFLALYRLLFILYAEARDERLIQHQFYQRSYSLDQLVARLLRTPWESLPANRHGLWMHLQALFRIFNEGISLNLPDLENIPPRGGRLFSEETDEGRLLRSLRLNDRDVASIVLLLATTHPRRGVGRERVSFRELEIEQLGHVYEGLLEYDPGEAKQLMVEVSVGGRDLALTPEEIVRLCEQKQLQVRGDAALIAGTAAAHLHAELAAEEGEEQEDPDEGESDELEERSEETGEEEPGIKRGASVTLLRRIAPGEFFFRPGAARKSSGSYYTPTAMVDDLVRYALGPLVEGRDAADIERLRVIDIACGSGHFLVGAARFLGPKLFDAYRRQQGPNPPPEFHPDRPLSGEVRTRWEAEGQDWCRRRIVERCLFGVDQNPAAVQLAQVALWIESLAGDRPLSFFSHHIRCGNSLLGSSLARFDAPPDPQLGKPGDRLTRGLFEAELKHKLNEALRERRLIDAPLPPEVRRDTPEEYAYKEDRLRRADAGLAQAKLLLDLRSASPLLPVIWRELPMLMSSFDLEFDARARPWWPQFESLRSRERFFHWELEFPEVLLDREHPGFDAVLGNPPWDKVLPSKLEFYGQFDALIRAYKGNELDRRIRELNAEHPGLESRFTEYRERATTVARVLRGGGDFPRAEARSQSAHEDVAKYFVDRVLSLVTNGGAAGLVVPSVFYNGDGWVGIRRYLLEEATIQRFYGFENRRKVFPIDSRYKFVSLVVRKNRSGAGNFTAAFMRQSLEELEDASPKAWQVQMTLEEITRFSPDTLAFLEYRNVRDQEIVRKMYAARPTLGGAAPGNWGVRLMSWRAHEAVFNSAEDKDLFSDPRSGKLYTPKLVLGFEPGKDAEAAELMRAEGFWPVFEGKLMDQFLVGVKPIRWWLSVAQAKAKYGKEPRGEPTLVFRETARNTDERTCIAAVLPIESAAAHTLTGMVVERVDPEKAATVLNSLCFDYALRLRTAGTHVSFTYILPMPVPPAEAVNRLPPIETRSAWQAGIQHVTDDKSLWPLLWEGNRAVAEEYGLSPIDLQHILTTFPVMTRKRRNFIEFISSRISDWLACIN
jgi:Eco57I restriction-modification methylase